MNLPSDPDNSTGSLENTITNQSFNEQSKYTRVTTKDFINSLSVQKFSGEQNITCGICLEELSVGEDVIELPCTDKHYFHIKKENCPGIYPWLKKNNSCPMCRHEFPYEEIERDEEDSPTRDRHRLPPMIITPNILRNMLNTVIEEEEERMLQGVLYDSLNNT